MTEIDITDKLTPKLKPTEKGLEIELYYLDKPIVTILQERVIKEESIIKEIEKEYEIKRIQEAIKKYNIEPHTIQENWGLI